MADQPMIINLDHTLAENWYYNKLPVIVPKLLDHPNQFIKSVGERINATLSGNTKEIENLSEQLKSKRPSKNVNYWKSCDYHYTNWFSELKKHFNERKELFNLLTEQLIVDIIGEAHFEELKDCWFMKYLKKDDFSFTDPASCASGLKSEGSLYMELHDVNKNCCCECTISDKMNSHLLDLSEESLISCLSIPNNYNNENCIKTLKGIAEKYYNYFISAYACPL
ncbi:MAG: hypothetical protein WC307_05285 [Candidatus Nanoarchaeia archaeon]|jgi:hypothetical protein